MLDHTVVYYGCSNSKTHVNRDYPLLVCGGRNIGLEHGEFHRFGGKNENSKVPLTNLYVTLLNSLDVPTDQYSDSTGDLSGINSARQQLSRLRWFDSGACSSLCSDQTAFSVSRHDLSNATARLLPRRTCCSRAVNSRSGR